MSRALVLSGGGSKGCFQVGVIKQLVEKGVKFDYVYGTSVGALNAVGLAYVGIEELERVWLGIRGNSDIIKFDFKSLFFSAPGFYKTDPLRKKIEKIVVGKPSMGVAVSYVDQKDGVVRYAYSYRDRAIPWHAEGKFADYVLASASMPVVMHPVYGSLVDGGIKDVAPLRPAIKDGHDEIIAVHTSPLSHRLDAEENVGKWSWVKHLMRTFEVMGHEIVLNDYHKCYERNNKNGYRTVKLEVYAPDKLVIDTLEFNPAKIRLGIKQGYGASPLTELPFY